MKNQKTENGFIWGSAEVKAYCSDEKKEWVIIGIETPKYPNGLRVYVTKTGKIRVYDDKNNEWEPKKK
jgi:hypothetical protein